MVGLVLVCSVLLAAGPDEPTTPSALEIKAYHDARAQAGRDPDKQVQLALWCEAHGLHAERLVHLARAVLADPSHAAARGLMGLVPYQGRWERPEAVADRVEADAKLTAALAEYNAKRAKAKSNDADDQWALAVWCEQHDLKAEASAHFMAVTRLEPKREAAWKRLGYARHNGRWMTDEQVAEQKADARAQKDADKHWEPLLTKWKGWLGKDKTRADAEAALAGVTDPRAVPSVWKVFALSGSKDQERAVQVLGQIDSTAATRALAELAMTGRAAEVRRAALETLRGRDPRPYLDDLIALLIDPIKYEVKPVGGPGLPGILVVEGKRFDLQRRYTPPPIPWLTLRPSDRVSYDANGLPVVVRDTGRTREGMVSSENPYAGPGNFTGLPAPVAGDLGKIRQQAAANFDRNFHQETQDRRPLIATYREQETIPVGQIITETQRAARVAEQQLESDVQRIKASNHLIHANNARVLEVLSGATGQDLGEDQDAWNRWWTNEQGYALASVSDSYQPVIVQQIAPAYNPPPIQIEEILVGVRRHSCFGAGTLVQTLTGLQAIETLCAGDLVLVQDTISGGLSYQPIVAVFHNPPNQTLRVTLDNQSIVVTAIHRFWRPGAGWVMARDLKPGDAVRTIAGLAHVAAVSDGSIQRVFNLEVAKGQSFFVGEIGALVHDNSLIRPTPAPFDAAPTLVSRQED